MTDPGTAALVFAGLYAAHQVADHWVQTEHQAAHKGAQGWPGRLACAAHVTTYTLTAGFALVLIIVGTTVALNPANVAVGLAISAVTHYIADRRTPLRKIAELFGHHQFYKLGTPREGHDDNPSLGTGAYALDQSWHIGWLFFSALMACGGVS